MSLEFGTVPDWLGVAVNGAVAVAAVVGLRHARQDARRAEERADAAQAELAADRVRRERARQARDDLQAVNAILELHASLVDQYVSFNPGDYGRLRACLAVLPPGSLPKTRALHGDDDDGRSATRPSNVEVTKELRGAAQELRRQMIAAA